MLFFIKLGIIVSRVGEVMNFCNDYHFLEGIMIIRYIIFVLKIVIPILLIGFGTYDFVQTVLNPDKNDLTSKAKSFGFRVASAVMIFLLPTIITTVFSIATNFSNTLMGLNDCIKNANKGYIEQLKIADKIRLQELENKTENYTSKYDSSKYQNVSNTEILEVAQRLWQQIAGGDFTYGGTSIPPTNVVDCSAYITWILYELGYKDEFYYQHNTLNFIETNWNEKFGWEEIPVTAGEDVTSKLQPGDILVRDKGTGGNGGHMNITVSVEGGKVMGYDCGKEDRWRKSQGQPADVSWFANDYRPGKIIRVTTKPTESSVS